jgi:hypothetical protein
MLSVETSCHVVEQKEQEIQLEALSLFNFSFSWPTTTTHATTRSSLLSLSHRHGSWLKITSVRAFSVHLHTHSLGRQFRRARDFGHVSRRSHHGHPEQVTTVSIPYYHPFTNNGMLHRILAWPSLLLGLSAWINQHPLRTREGSTPPIGNLMYSFHPSCITCGPKSPFLLTGLHSLLSSRPIFPTS